MLSTTYSEINTATFRRIKAIPNPHKKNVHYSDDHLYVFPGSFNPYHLGHREILETVSFTQSVLEICITPKDKGTISEESLQSRIDSIRNLSPMADIAFSNATFFKDKIKALQRNPDILQGKKIVFLLGSDTARRVIQDHSLEELENLEATFIVYKRRGEKSIDLPKNFRFYPKPLVYQNIRSSDLRAGLEPPIDYRNLPIVWPTVDIGIWNRDHGVLLGRKKTDPQGKWRFPGGFVDTTDKGLQEAAYRELLEEVKDLTPFFMPEQIYNSLEYVTSEKVPDPRFENSEDVILTTLFACELTLPESLFKKTTHYFPSFRAGDDLDSVMWFGENFRSYLIDCHKGLGEKLYEHIKNKV